MINKCLSVWTTPMLLLPRVTLAIMLHSIVAVPSARVNPCASFWYTRGQRRFFCLLFRSGHRCCHFLEVPSIVTEKTESFLIFVFGHFLQVAWELMLFLQQPFPGGPLRRVRWSVHLCLRSLHIRCCFCLRSLPGRNCHIRSFAQINNFRLVDLFLPRYP